MGMRRRKKQTKKQTKTTKKISLIEDKYERDAKTKETEHGPDGSKSQMPMKTLFENILFDTIRSFACSLFATG